MQRLLSLSRRPLAWWIGVLGVALGFPMGRLLREPPWKAEALTKRAVSESTTNHGKAVPPGGSSAPGRAVVAVATGAGDSSQTEAVRIAAGLFETYKRWSGQTGLDFRWMPLHLVREAIALAGRADVDRIVSALPAGRAQQLVDVIMAAWGDRDPSAAWRFFLRALKERKIGYSSQFVRRMARYHRALVEPGLADLGVSALPVLDEIWRAHLQEAVDNPERLRQIILTEVPEDLRALCADRAIWLLAAEHPERAAALLEELAERDRAGLIPRFAELLARNQPAMALDLVRTHRGEMHYTGRDDRDSADLVFSAMLRRESAAPALKLMAELYGKNLSDGTPGNARNLPRRTQEWMPAAVAAAQGQRSGADFLAELIQYCPWERREDVCGEIAGITDPPLQAAAAEAWAWRWSADDPDAARQWQQSLPSAAGARALCGLWRKGMAPNVPLEACTRAGTMPSEGALTEMILSEPELTSAWLADQPGITSRQLARAARTWSSVNPAAAAEWAAGFSESGERVQAVAAVVQVWLRDAPEAAATWLESSALDDAEWSAVQNLTGLNAFSRP